MVQPQSNNAIPLEWLPTPHPYKAAIAICSDLDGTKDLQTYIEILEFLNTDRRTRTGEGLSLEVATSIHFRAQPDYFSYWNTDAHGQSLIHALIRSGHIDCLHSFGEKVYSRADAETALTELVEHGCYLKVWTDHGNAQTNLGPDIMRGAGDLVDQPAYHADLSLSYGIVFAWLGRVTSVIGQNVRPSLRGLTNPRHPFASLRCLVKERLKQLLGRYVCKRYLMHSSNELLRLRPLRNGRTVYEFLRCNPHWAGVSHGDTGQHLYEVICDRFLERLTSRNALCILYTHLGKNAHWPHLFPRATVQAFTLLRKWMDQKLVLVTTTRRILGFARALKECRASGRRDGAALVVDIVTSRPPLALPSLDPSDYQGLSLCVPASPQVKLSIDGTSVHEIAVHGGPNSATQVVSIPWNRLAFPLSEVSN